KLSTAYCCDPTRTILREHDASTLRIGHTTPYMGTGRKISSPSATTHQRTQLFDLVDELYGQRRPGRIDAEVALQTRGDLQAPNTRRVEAPVVGPACHRLDRAFVDQL